MSEKKGVEATLDDLPSVDTTNPILQPVDTSPALPTVDSDPRLKPLRTITLDEDPPAAPSSTLLLDPVEDVATDPKMRATVPHDIGISAAVTTPRKRKALKDDAFESAPSLAPTRSDHAVQRGPTSPWKRTQVWTPGLVLLTAALVFMVLVTIVMLSSS